MKPFFTSLLFPAVLFIAFSCHAQGDDRLIAHWNFNGNANDISGNSFNGLVTGATLATGYSGVANTAYYFNGSSDHIDVPYSPVMNIDSSYFICALIKPLGFYSGYSQGNFILMRGVENSETDDYQLGYFDNAYDSSNAIYSPTHEVFYTSGLFINGPLWYPGNTVIDTATWYCVVATYDGDTVKLYINGIQKKAFYAHRTYSAGTDAIGIGYNPASVADYPYWINAVVDDIRVYGRALSSTEASTYCDSAEGVIPSSVQQLPVANPELVIYPNPSHGDITIDIPFNTGTNLVQFYNAMGQLVMSQTTELHWLHYNINILPAGTYFVKVQHDGQIFAKRFTKE